MIDLKYNYGHTTTMTAPNTHQPTKSIPHPSPHTCHVPLPDELLTRLRTYCASYNAQVNGMGTHTAVMRRALHEFLERNAV